MMNIARSRQKRRDASFKGQEDPRKEVERARDRLNHRQGKIKNGRRWITRLARVRACVRDDRARTARSWDELIYTRVRILILTCTTLGKGETWNHLEALGNHRPSSSWPINDSPANRYADLSIKCDARIKDSP